MVISLSYFPPNLKLLQILILIKNWEIMLTDYNLSLFPVNLNA